ncbi:MAG: single-stranded DNA-binding protein [Verrucomicrobiota bacterium]|nr:single-stranded DNA-binding protein [Verrucomicrobiota bacterium]
MASLNRVYLIGNLTRDPEVRYLPSGVAVGDLRLAVTEKFKNKAGELQESTCFVDVVVWSRDAENAEKYLSKGSPMLVEGALQLDEWKTKEGENRSRLRVRAIRIQFLGAPRSGEARDGKGKAAPTAAPPAAAPTAAAPEEPPAMPAEESPGGPRVEGTAATQDDDNLPF